MTSAPHSVPSQSTKSTLQGDSQTKGKGCSGCLPKLFVFAILSIIVCGFALVFASNDVKDPFITPPSNISSTKSEIVIYDPVTPEVTNPVVLVDDRSIRITVDGGGGVLQGSSTYPRYCVPILVENKTFRNVQAYFADDSANNLDDDSYVMLWPYADLDSGEHNDYYFNSNSTEVGWIEVGDYNSAEPIKNFKATLVLYDADDFSTIGEYPVNIPEL